MGTTYDQLSFDERCQIAEITDSKIGPSDRIQGAKREWSALVTNPRGLPDFGIWREDESERLRLNREFDRHRDAVQRLLS